MYCEEKVYHSIEHQILTSLVECDCTIGMMQVSGYYYETLHNMGTKAIQPLLPLGRLSIANTKRSFLVPLIR